MASRTIIFTLTICFPIYKVYVNGGIVSAEDEVVKPFLPYVKILICDGRL